MVIGRVDMGRKISIHDCNTGESCDRDMTPEEEAQADLDESLLIGWGEQP
jgi:hypothetical protein